MILEIFKDAESVRSGLSHVPSQPALLPPYRDPGGMLSRKDKPPDIWDTHGFSGNVFVNPPASSSSPFPVQGFNLWIPYVTEHISPHVTSERQNSDTGLDPRCQSGPWPGGWGLQGRRSTGGGGLARVPKLRVWKYPDWRVAHAGREG